MILFSYLIAERLFHGIQLVQGVDSTIAAGQTAAAITVVATEAVIAAAIATKN